jgi:hypothetical protein
MDKKFKKHKDILDIFTILDDNGEIIGSLGNIDFIKYKNNVYLTADTLMERINNLYKK